MEVRRWKYTDIYEIAEFEKENFVDPWTYKMLADSFVNELFYGFLITDNGKIVATSAYNMSLDEVEIVNVLVKNDMRRKGLGKTLMNAMIEDMKRHGIIRIFLEVREHNLSAQALYKSFGFEKINIRKGYYGGIENAIVMRKDLERE